jgi:hypothetical protein
LALIAAKDGCTGGWYCGSDLLQVQCRIQRIVFHLTGLDNHQVNDLEI